jgi:acyl-CoA dehydrogenase
VEGAIAKYWGTEAGNRAAELSIQALGGYGYTREYMVEKIKRDVRITTIYEGTSEILQSVIGMYRWKATVKSKGDWYEAMAAEMDTACVEAGSALVASSLRDLNATIRYTHSLRLTSRQSVMFRLADMMTAGEVACALVRKAGRLQNEGHADAAEFLAMSRIFARRVRAMVDDGCREAVLGHLGSADAEKQTAGAEFIGGLQRDDLTGAHLGLLDDLCTMTECIGRKVV